MEKTKVLKHFDLKKNPVLPHALRLNEKISE